MFEIIFGAIALLILFGSLLFALGLLLWTSLAAIFAGGEPHHSSSSEAKRYVGITEKSYDFDED